MSKIKLKQCFFYHTMDIPGYGEIKGVWDLRANPDGYLGKLNLSGKRILEIGPANGFFTFYMEKKGAKVVCLELSDKDEWDIVPYKRFSYEKRVKERQKKIRQASNAFWLAHKAFRSKSKVVNGSVYEIDKYNLGKFDIAIFGSVLLHLRDPFLAMQKVLSKTTGYVVITEPFWRYSLPLYIFGKLFGPAVSFLPDYRWGEPVDGWWNFTPEAIKSFLGVLGFENTKTNYHMQKYLNKWRLLYTIVGSRKKFE